MTIDLKTLDDAELTALTDAIEVERRRRSVIANAADAVARINEQVLEAEGIEPGDLWRLPDGVHNAYPENWVVTWAEKEWSSLCPANLEEPGVGSQWDELPPPEDEASQVPEPGDPTL